MKYSLNNIYNIDCMLAMKNIPDKYFELAIVDPPYFSGPEKRNYYGAKISRIGVKRSYTPSTSWEIPKRAYFNELFRVSKNQIIWGCNYYKDIEFHPGRIIWNKCNGASSYSDCEIAYCSMHHSVRMFSYVWNGMLQGKGIQNGHISRGNKKHNEKRIHPTQKPVDLYKWLLSKYATKGDKVLDTHLGSGSSIIACYDMGFEFLGFEIDKRYYSAALNRYCFHTAQVRMDI